MRTGQERRSPCISEYIGGVTTSGFSSVGESSASTVGAGDRTVSADTSTRGCSKPLSYDSDEEGRRRFTPRIAVSVADVVAVAIADTNSSRNCGGKFARSTGGATDFAFACSAIGIVGIAGISGIACCAIVGACDGACENGAIGGACENCAVDGACENCAIGGACEHCAVGACENCAIGGAATVLPAALAKTAATAAAAETAMAAVVEARRSTLLQGQPTVQTPAHAHASAVSFSESTAERCSAIEVHRPRGEETASSTRNGRQPQAATLPISLKLKWLRYKMISRRPAITFRVPVSGTHTHTHTPSITYEYHDGTINLKRRHSVRVCILPYDSYNSTQLVMTTVQDVSTACLLHRSWFLCSLVDSLIRLHQPVFGLDHCGIRFHMYQSCV